MKVYEMEIVPERDPRCVRRIEFLGSQTLYDVHRQIRMEFDLDPDHRWAFFLSGEYFDRDTQFGGTPLDGGTAAKARLDGLDLEQGMLIAYVLDFGDEQRHSVRVLRIAEAESGVEYPRVTHCVGLPPPQCQSRDGDGEPGQEGGDEAQGGKGPSAAGPAPRERFVPPSGLVQRVQRAMRLGTFRRQEGGEHREEEEGEAGEEEEGEAGEEEEGFRREDLAVIGEVLDVCSTVPELIDLCETVQADVVRWTGKVLDEALGRGLAEEVEPLAARLGRADPTSLHHHLWAMALLRTGRREEALGVMASYRPEDGPDAVRHRIRSARVVAAAGDVEAAERELRAVLGLRWLSGRARQAATEGLEPILAATGRRAEAQRMLDELFARRWARLTGRPATVRQEGPKVARNAPCPCGSGKKFKKCCEAGGG